MIILALEKDLQSAPGQDRTRLLREEALRVWQLYREGTVREMFFRQDRSSAVLVLECQNAIEADSILRSLPLVREGQSGFEIIPLCPYPGFARLFAEGA